MASTSKIKGGLKRPRVITSAIDPEKTRTAKVSTGTGGGMTKQAGMMVDFLNMNAPYQSGFKLDSYRSSYASGLGDRTGAYDIPTYFLMMMQQNGGLIYWPVTLMERYGWFRYFVRTDAYVGRAMELLSDLPMSKLTLTMPKMPKGKKALGQEILEFFTYQLEVLNMFELCQNILFENNVIGNCFPADHLIFTELGMAPISEIRDGDMVLTASGNYSPVSAIMRRHVSEWLVDLDIARLPAIPFTPTQDHPVFILRDGIEKMVLAKEIQVGDYVGVANDETIRDVDVKDISTEIKDILQGRYDSVAVQKMGEHVVVSTSYKTPSGISLQTSEMKEALLSWVQRIQDPVEMSCEQVATILGIADVSKLRNVASLMRKRGIIKTERCGGGQGKGSSIRWHPLAHKPDLTELYGRVFEKTFTSNNAEIDIDADFLYVLGYWLGDGWLWKYKRPTSYPYLAFDICAEKNTSQVDRLKSVMSSVFGEDGFTAGDSIIFGERDNMFHVSVEDPIFCAWWGHNFGSNCETKKLPQWVMQLPPEKQIQILRGLIDSDGCVSGNSVSISNTNKNLMYQIFLLGIRCGIPFTFGESKQREIPLPNGSKVISHGIYHLGISGQRAMGLVISCEKERLLSDQTESLPCRGYTNHNGKFYFEVNNVGQKFHDGFVYNLEVEGDHTYCANLIRTHNCYIFCEWDEQKKMWSKAVILPPEEVYVFQYPFSDNKRVEYRPQRLIQLIKDGAAMVSGGSATPDGSTEMSENGNSNMRANLERDIVDNMPKELCEMVRKEGCILMDSDPMTGSFVHHIARRRHPYMDLGASVLERVLVPLLQKEHYRYTQLSLASRNMTPKNLITAPLLMPSEVDNLRTQVDLSFLDPEYSVITNYEVNWQQIGPTERLLDFAREYEQIENQIFAALGVTRELLTGEGTFSGSKITVEILNTMFLMTREILKTFIEKKLFIKVCEEHEWFEVGKNNIKKYWYPQVGFNRLTIRDNSEVFDSLYQLYSKGSLPVDVIYELFNLNVDEINAKLRNDMFTVKDSTSNRFSETVNTDLGRAVVEKTDILEKMAKYLGLKIKPEASPEAEGGNVSFGETPPPAAASTNPEEGDVESVLGQSEGQSVLEQVSEPKNDSSSSEKTDVGTSGKSPQEIEQLADRIHKALPPNADAEDISAVIDKIGEKMAKVKNAKKVTNPV